MAHVQIAKVKQAGAIVLGKTNMAEWAFSPDISTGSAFGVVRNPYAMDYSTGGSSGGTAAGTFPSPHKLSQLRLQSFILQPVASSKNVLSRPDLAFIVAPNSAAKLV